MKRGDKPSGDTPYRIDTQSEEAVRQNKQLIKEMEKNIEMSGKFSIQLPENLGPEDAPLQCHIPNLDLPNHLSSTNPREEREFLFISSLAFL